MNFTDELKNPETVISTYRIALRLAIDPSYKIGGYKSPEAEYKFNHLLLTAFIAKYSTICDLDDARAKTIAAVVLEAMDKALL